MGRVNAKAGRQRPSERRDRAESAVDTLILRRRFRILCAINESMADSARPMKYPG
jgi:hypothetical protein